MAIVPCENYNSETVSRSIEKAIDLLGGINEFVKPNQKVLIKPNLCLPATPEKALTTHPQVVKQVAACCLEAGTSVTIGDNPVGKPDSTRRDDILECSGIKEIVDSMGCKYSNLNRDKLKCEVDINNKKYDYFLTKEIYTKDFVINLPKLKTHSLMVLSGAVKNLYGLIPGALKKKLHGLLPDHEDFATLLVDIYHKANVGLHIMDAVVGIQGDGPGIQGEPRYIGVIIASKDGIALDSVVAKLIGLMPNDIHTNRLGCVSGIGESDISKIKIVGSPLENFVMNDFKLPQAHRYNNELTKKVFDIARINIKIDKNICEKCKLCFDICPVKGINIENESVEIDKQKCISCMSCHEICPAGAVKAQRSLFYEQLSRMKKRSE